MVSYKELGLVNTREMFAKAIKGGYAIPAFNFNNMEQLQAIIQAAAETKSPVILQVSKGARNYANQTLLRYMAEGAVEYAKELGWAKPQIVLHLDHGDSFETCKSCVDMGCSSVMIDGSSLPYDENVALTKKVVDRIFLTADLGQEIILCCLLTLNILLIFTDLLVSCLHQFFYCCLLVRALLLKSHNLFFFLCHLFLFGLDGFFCFSVCIQHVSVIL